MTTNVTDALDAVEMGLYEPLPGEKTMGAHVVYRAAYLGQRRLLSHDEIVALARRYAAGYFDLLPDSLLAQPALV